jgi:hypothetical protein
MWTLLLSHSATHLQKFHEDGAVLAVSPVVHGVVEQLKVTGQHTGAHQHVEVALQKLKNYVNNSFYR